MSTAAEKEWFERSGLYDPAYEHDACGVGFVAHIKGQKSHALVTQALKILENLDHRGADQDRHGALREQVHHRFFFSRGHA